ncbi:MULTISPECIES: GntR family transcriptional regulator [Salipiger]|jgi:GntR family transcriptional regulator|uniref:GntR family transcriptional regulator n=1 Tax=Salipiger profundus TaxID=1229727 RepID=A0A1U7DAA8_9RHOB|nr:MULTISPECIES: GntR family transcriptional regulator [Salipiger]APX25000.1 GntR family transcriptional regulator [Salipiger profundus]SFD13189.1 transcriptional regulator, GntR family [Salipiger profundus]
MTTHNLKQGSVTLYAQLATILRDRVYTGTWPAGSPIPTLDELTREFEVARVTARQAVQLLCQEGLLSSQRGKRTQVIWEPPDISHRPIFSSTGSLDESPATYSVDVLDYEEFDHLPLRRLAEGTDAGPYVRIRKRDLYKGMPYACSENYVRLDLYRRFPPGGETVSKIIRLVRDAARPRQTTGSELIRVSMPTETEAMQLQCALGAPVARISRVLLDEDGSVLLHGEYTYCARDFALTRDITSLLHD